MNFGQTFRTMVLAAFLAPTYASAQDTVTIKVGYGPGGGFDTAARVVAEYLGKFLPGNPDVIVENVPGAGSYKLAKMIGSSEPSDGSVIGVVSPSLSQMPVLDPDNVEIGPEQYNWLASFRQVPSYCFISKAAGINSFEEMLAADILFGASGKGSTTYLYPTIIKNVFNANFSVVTGFDGGQDINLAIQRGEIHGRCGIDLIGMERDGIYEYAIPIAKMGVSAGNEMPDLPFVIDLAPSEIDRAALEYILTANEIMFPFIFPPNTPDDITATFREALRKVSVDEEFLAEAEKRQINIVFRDGETVQNEVEKLADVSEEVAKRVVEIVQ